MRYQHPVVARKSNQITVICTVQRHGHIAICFVFFKGRLNTDHSVGGRAALMSNLKLDV